MSVSITDIAKHLKLSNSTVSKALNGYSDVSDQTRERVMQTAQDMGYQPSAAARSLRRGRTD
ncbi:MAG: LacI family DNA-binding transcriptional regulator, partial [Chloroflexota bacterium]